MTDTDSSKRDHESKRHLGDAEVSALRQTATISLLLLGLFVVGFFLYRLLKDTNISQGSDTISQVLWLTLAVVMLLVVLLAIAVVLRVLNPNGGTTALGLPEGSVSAVIALALLILFSLSSVYVYATLRQTESNGRVSTGLSIEDVRGLPQDRVLTVNREPGSDPPTYAVALTNPSATSMEVGRTTLATISTLLVAIVGFYFGQRAAEKNLERTSPG